ncbi:MAG: glutamate--tRNA ligase family protein [Hyphomonadaceae bacterium]
MVREDGALPLHAAQRGGRHRLRITHIVRGEDHVTNSGVQIEIFEALGGAAPKLGHFPLLVGYDGNALSKRIGSLGVGELAAEGYEPMTALAPRQDQHSGSGGSARHDRATAAEFSFEKIGRAPARFDPEDLKRVNAQLLHQYDYATVQDRLVKLGADKGEAFWNAVRANLVLLKDVQDYARIVDGPIEPVVADAAFAAAAAEVLPTGAYDATTWQTFTNAVKEKTGAKGKALFMPLRQALTGMDHGPEMAALFPLIGEERARKRLRGQAA